MDWMAILGQSWLTFKWLLSLAVVFGLLARLLPCNPGMYWWKDLRAVATDCIYWFIVPLFLRLGRTIMLIAGMSLLFSGRDSQLLPVRELPLWQQCVLILLIQDLLLYWIHRLFHSRLAWKFHAVHHSPRVLDWMSFARSHPINTLLEFILADVVVLLMGFAPTALIVLAPFSIVYSAMVHANLNWTFGPLRYVFASPVFHRWHHTTLAEGLDKNFASTFPFLDVIFGTFYMPPGTLPERFGDGEFPSDFWGQFLHPFHNSKPQSERPWTWRRHFVALALGAGLLAILPFLSDGPSFKDGNREGMICSIPSLTEPSPPHEACCEKCRVFSGHRGAVYGVAMTSDGRRIASGSEDGSVRIWNVDTGQALQAFHAHDRPIRSIALSADGKRLVSGSYDRTAKVWDTETGQLTHTLTGHTGFVLSVSLSADGQRLVSASSDGTIKIWNAETGVETCCLSGDMGTAPCVAISANGGRLVSGIWNMAKTWNIETRRELHCFEGHQNLVYCVAISAMGDRIVTGSFDEQAKLWDAATGEEKFTVKGHEGSVTSVAVSAEGRTIASGGQDGMVKLWDSQDFAPIAVSSTRR